MNRFQLESTAGARRGTRTAIICLSLLLPIAAAAQSGPSDCAREREWVATEAGTPGILLRMAQEALAACLARLAAAGEGGQRVRR